MDELNDLMPISPDHNRERLETPKQLFSNLFTKEAKQVSSASPAFDSPPQKQGVAR